jgi:energy-coupling factor transporter ATP-binding protein EcfA2
MFSNRPVTPRDAELFTGRTAELDEVVSAAQAGENVLVFGQSGAGKTSLLAMAAHRLRTCRSHRTVMVEAALADGAAGLVELIADVAVGPRTVLVPGRPLRISSALGTYEPRPTSGGRLLDAVDRLGSGLAEEDDGAVPGDEHGPYWEPGSPMAVFVDDVPSKTLAELFGAARDAVWALPCVWVVSADTGVAAALQPDAELFFERRVELGPLTPPQAVELLRARAQDSGGVPHEVLEQIAAAAAETPRSLVQAARHVLAQTGSRPRAQAQTAAAALGRAPAMLVSVLQGMAGAASASDPDLLSKLGWSRARASQVMRQLEEAGLVTSAVAAPAAASGRPRKLYRLVEDLR